MDPLRLGNKVDKLLDGQQKARFRELAGIEKLLFTKLFSELSAGLEESNGRITSRKGFVSLSKAIDRIFDAIDERQFSVMAKNTAGDMAEMLAASSGYYGSLQVINKTSFLGVKSSVDATMRKRLGIGKGKQVTKNGYLDQLFRAGAARDEVKKMVEKAVSAGIPMRQLEKQLKVKVQGTRTNAGVLEKHIGGFVLDTYQKADSIANNEFGKQLGLKYFVYSGGLIETSRAFCIKRNNKVFTTKEAEGWKNDPTLPRSKAERDSGVVTDYIPLEDRGRWRCRHRLLYVSDQMAFRMRPELGPKDQQAPPKSYPPNPYPDAKRVPDAGRKVDLAQVMGLAEGAAPQLDRIGKDIAASFNSTVTPINLKSKDSIVRKAEGEEDGDYSKIKDAVRSTIVADRNKHADIIDAIKDTPVFWRVKEQKFDVDLLGYSGTIVNVIADNGAIGEIQVNTAPMIFAKEKESDARRILGSDIYDAISKATGQPGGLGHTYYEEWRVLASKVATGTATSAQARRKVELERMSKAYYAHFR